MLEMSPYLLLGFLFAGLLKVYFPQRWIDKYMGKNDFTSVFNAALLGVPIPLCSCGVIPTGISLHRNGASKGASVAFLISTPQTGVDSIMVTYSMLGLPFALIRMLVALVTGILGGLLTNSIDGKSTIETFQDKNSCSTSSNKKVHPLITVFRYGFVEFLMDIAKWLIIGVILAAILAVVIPDNFFSLYIDNEWLSMLLVLVASVPLYICATASVPIAAVLMMKGLSAGAALIFLMAGPATNAATIVVLNKVLGRKTLFSYLAAIISGAVIFGIAMNHLLPPSWFALSEHMMHHSHEHDMLPLWFKIASAIVLIALIIRGYVARALKNRQQMQLIKQPVPQSVLINRESTAPAFTVSGLSFANANQHVFEVHGMTCNHCKNSVETNLSKLKGITSVNANPQTKMVVVTGQQFDENEIKIRIEQLGFEFIGKK
jgi:uncharacterized membrane protein YraQ (UPF0718 family)/copper chaperone CopZ